MLLIVEVGKPERFDGSDALVVYVYGCVFMQNVVRVARVTCTYGRLHPRTTQFPSSVSFSMAVTVTPISMALGKTHEEYLYA